LKKLIKENNLLLLCTIVDYRGKNVNYNASIALIEENFTIEIYRFAQIKQYYDKQSENNLQNLEQKKELELL
jgi:hypothetical protein